MTQKLKVEEAPAPKAKPKPTTSSPRKAKEPVIARSLPRDSTMPIDVTFDGESSQASRRKEGDYGHVLKLAAPSSFTLVKSASCTIPAPLSDMELTHNSARPSSPKANSRDAKLSSSVQPKPSHSCSCQRRLASACTTSTSRQRGW